MANVHISISAEPLTQIGGFTVTNATFTSALISIFLILFAVYANSQLKHTRRPKGLQNILELLVGGLYDFVHDITHNKQKTNIIFPMFASSFIFIIFNNWFGLLPGVGTIGVLQEPEPSHANSAIISQAHANTPLLAQQNQDMHEEVVVDPNGEQDQNPVEEAHPVNVETNGSQEATFVPIFRAGTADLNTTIALALISVIFTQYVGIKFLGLGYFSKFFNLNGIHAFVGILELVSEISKIISFAFRLFGNIFAGEVLLVVIAFLVPLIAPIPFIGLEIFVGFIQALVFAFLTLVFTYMATEGHADSH